MNLLKAPVMFAKAKTFKVTTKIVKYSPEILTIGGIGMFIGAVFTAPGAQTEAEKVIERHQERVEKENNAIVDFPNDMNETVYKKDMVMIYKDTTLGLIKSYSKPIVLSIVGSAMILYSFKILKARQAILISTCAGLQNLVDRYSSEVTKRYGEEVNYQIRNGLDENNNKVKAIDKTDTDDKKSKDVAEEDSIYSRIFEETNPNWRDDASLNMFFLKSVETSLNNLLKSRASRNSYGLLFLNEVYDALGFPRTKQGQVVGWALKKSNDGGIVTDGDGYISFGLNRHLGANNPLTAFQEGAETNVLLEFNVDGVIFDKI